ncbi:MAG: helix-turn-helix transcriptional regulator [Pseudoclavibacter sp.]|nr:helix-turn-helix transcriptional regulator [Pseudoclavibacter sp.]
MGQKPMGTAGPLSQQVAREIDHIRRQTGITVSELVRLAGMGANTYYTKMRGERPFTTNEVDNLARALGLSAQLLLVRAEDSITPKKQQNRG